MGASSVREGVLTPAWSLWCPTPERFFWSIVSPAEFLHTFPLRAIHGTWADSGVNRGEEERAGFLRKKTRTARPCGDMANVRQIESRTGRDLTTPQARPAPQKTSEIRCMSPELITNDAEK